MQAKDETMRATILSAVLMSGGVILAGCGGDQKSMTDTPEPKSMSEKEREVSDQEVAEVMADGPAFDAEFGKRVLERGERKAQECGAMGAPVGEGEVTVVFDGEKGRVTEVELGYPYADASEQAQKCIKNAFMGEMIPPFDGMHKETHAFTISEKDDEKE